MRDRRRMQKNDFSFKTEKSSIIYSGLLRTYHRLLFNTKINFLFRSLIDQIEVKGIGLSHATTLLSDGALAYKIFKKYDIPYIVTVRSTDVDVFLKFRPDLLLLALKVVKNAHQIIFISKAIEKKFLSHYFLRCFSSLVRSKSCTIYNGVNRIWLDNNLPKRDLMPNKVLYVGTFIKRKRLQELIAAIIQLRELFPKIRLCVVGGRGRMERKIMQLIQKNDFIEYKGLVENTDDLIQIFRENHIFAMPSYNETFGLVYIEALSQGLPILMGKGEAIDGILENVGETVNPHSVMSIKEGLMTIISNYPNYEINFNDIQQFNWEKISKSYLKMYNEIL
nr:glycosyltransferase family 4 protein [Parapedobacter lycopersici]